MRCTPLYKRSMGLGLVGYAAASRWAIGSLWAGFYSASLVGLGKLEQSKQISGMLRNPNNVVQNALRSDLVYMPRNLIDLGKSAVAVKRETSSRRQNAQNAALNTECRVRRCLPAHVFGASAAT